MPRITIAAAGETATVDYSTSAALVTGARLADTTYAQSNPKVGPIRVTRLFYPGTLPASYQPPAGFPADVVPIVSYKTPGPNTPGYARSLAAVGGFLVWHHEPEADFPSGAAFVQQWQQERATVKSAAPGLPFGMIAGAFQYAAGNNGYDGSYIPDGADFYCVDTYLQGSATPPNKIQPLATEPRFQRWLSFVQPKGKPLGVTEYGRGLTDTTQWDAQRAQVIPQDADYLKSLGFKWWLYWYTSGGGSKSWRFTDAASQAAWRAVAA